MGIDGSTVVLETDRLLLRHLSLDDLDALAMIQADPEVMRYFPSGPRSRVEAFRELERCLNLQESYGFSLWAAIDKAEGRLIGRCGLLPQALAGSRRSRDRLSDRPGLLGSGPRHRGRDGDPRSRLRHTGARPARLDHPPRQPRFPAGRRESRTPAGADDPVHEASLLALFNRSGKPLTIASKGRLGLDRSTSYIVGASLSLATMGALAHGVGSRCDWLVVALVRAVVMFGSAATMARISGASLVVWRPRTLWVRSLAGSCSLVCNFYALTRLPVADAITLMNVHPLWIVLISAVVLRRVPTIGEFLGVACGLSGVILIERPHLSVDRVAAVVALLSSLSSAVAMLGLHRLRQIDTRAVVAHFAGVASLVAAVWLVLRGDLKSPGLGEPLTWLFLIGIGASGTIGQILLTKAYASGAPAKVAVVGLTQVVFAMGFDVVLWGRSLDPIALAGFVLVLAPTTWLSIRSARARLPMPNPPNPAVLAHSLENETAARD